VPVLEAHGLGVAGRKLVDLHNAVSQDSHQGAIGLWLVYNWLQGPRTTWVGSPRDPRGIDARCQNRDLAGRIAS
jgi:hypothetical protein